MDDQRLANAIAVFFALGGKRIDGIDCPACDNPTLRLVVLGAEDDTEEIGVLCLECGLQTVAPSPNPFKSEAWLEVCRAHQAKGNALARINPPKGWMTFTKPRARK